MKPWLEELLSLGEEEYRRFYAALLPTLDPETMIGVRMPRLRKFAKKMQASRQILAFLADLPHTYYEENLLHVILISAEKDMEKAVKRVNDFLPFADNWAVCDSLRPVAFRSSHQALLPWVEKWMASSHPYVCRFGIEVLMLHFLDEDFRTWMPKKVARIRSEEYYVNMMIAWYFATALFKREKEVLPYLEGEALSPFCRRMAIRKALESKRISPERKAKLRAMG